MSNVIVSPTRFTGFLYPICYWLPSSFFSSKASPYLYCTSYNFIPKKYPYATVYLERVMSTWLAPLTIHLLFSWSSLNHSAFSLPLMLAYGKPKGYSFHSLLPFSGSYCQCPGPHHAPCTIQTRHSSSSWGWQFCPGLAGVCLLLTSTATVQVPHLLSLYPLTWFWYAISMSGLETTVSRCPLGLCLLANNQPVCLTFGPCATF